MRKSIARGLTSIQGLDLAELLGVFVRAGVEVPGTGVEDCTSTAGTGDMRCCEWLRRAEVARSRDPSGVG
jgi:hypothetical protein